MIIFRDADGKNNIDRVRILQQNVGHHDMSRDEI